MYKHDICYSEQIHKEILEAEEGEVCNTKVVDVDVRDLDYLSCAFTALSGACPDLKTFTTVLTYYEIVCMKLFHSVSADYPWEKSNHR